MFRLLHKRSYKTDSFVEHLKFQRMTKAECFRGRLPYPVSNNQFTKNNFRTLCSGCSVTEALTLFLSLSTYKFDKEWQWQIIFVVFFLTLYQIINLLPKKHFQIIMFRLLRKTISKMVPFLEHLEFWRRITKANYFCVLLPNPTSNNQFTTIKQIQIHMFKVLRGKSYKTASFVELHKFR